MSKELIERLREVGPYEDVNTGLCHDAADLIEQQQSWIASLEQNARDADRMYKELETELAAAQAQIKVLREALEEIKSPVEFWISCHTEFEPDYSALLVLINKKLAKVRKP